MQKYLYIVILFYQNVLAIDYHYGNHLKFLGILAILVGINFYYQKDYSSVSDREKYCHGCSKKIGISDKYFANYGGKL